MILANSVLRVSLPDILMLIIHHRRNTRALLESTPASFGIEIDVRSSNNELIVQHDPFVEGVPLDVLLKGYRHSLLVVNIKEEGLEEKIMQELYRNKIEDFFFLDQSFPFLIKTATSGESRSAVRVSEYEAISTALNLSGLVQWCWIDYFTRFPLDKEQCDLLRSKLFRLCLVSPELQGYCKEECMILIDYIRDNDICVDAVCTKLPNLWSNSSLGLK